MTLTEQMREEMREIDKLLLQMAGQRSAIINHLTKLGRLVDTVEDQSIDTDVKAKLKELENNLDTLTETRTDVNSAASDLDSEVERFESAFNEVIRLLK